MTIEVESQGGSHGLKSNCLSFGEVIAQSFAGIAPSTIPAAVLGSVFALAGKGSWLSFLLGLAGIVFITFSINQFASRSASSGSLYSYISSSLGSTAGVICGWSLIFAYLFNGMAFLCGITNFTTKFLNYLGLHSLGLDIFILAVGAGITWYFAYRDVQLSTMTMLWLEFTSIVLILILCGIIWHEKGFIFDLSQLSLKGVSAGNVASGLVLVIFGFTGFEGAASLGYEAINPLKNIPRALIWSNIVSGVFFIVTAYVVILGFEGTGADLGKSDSPLTFLADRSGLSILGNLVAVGALLSFFAGLVGTLNPVARIVFTMSRYGIFPAPLGSAHDTYKTPHHATTLSSIIIFLIPLSMTVHKINLFDSLSYLGSISSFGFLTVYILISLAAPVYLFKIKKLEAKHVIVSILGISTMLFPFLGSIGIKGSSWFPIPDYPHNIFPFIFLGYLIITTSCFVIQRIRSPGIAKRMQEHIEDAHIQFVSQEQIIVSSSQKTKK